jgi:hypothetical protein
LAKATLSGDNAQEAALDLADLVFPLSAGEFLARYWPAGLYWTHGTAAGARLVEAWPRLASPTEILRVYRGQVSLLHPDGTALDEPGGASVVRAYQDGFTCYLRDVDRVSQVLDRLLRRMSQRIGMPRTSLTCELFCSTGSSGVAMHSDYDINFAILVRGAKRWQLARNEHLANQPGVCVPGVAQPDPRVSELLAGKVLPTSMPSSATKVSARAGTVIFVPRGWWHQTAASGECLQVNVVVKGPQYSQIVLAALESHLAADSRWRAFAHGMAGGEGERNQAAERLAALLSELRATIGLAGGDLELAKKLLAAYGER